MARRSIPFTTYASTTITADVPDEIADDPQAVADWILENCDFPTICSQCTGMGDKDKNLDLGDVWEPVRDMITNEVEMYDS